MQYLIKADSLIRAKERANNAGAEADAFLNELLDLSAGVLGAITHFRPFYCSAIFLQQSAQYQQLSKAEDGVEFTGMVRAIASLFATQASYDRKYQLLIPIGFEVVIPSSQISPFGSISLKTVVIP